MNIIFRSYIYDALYIMADQLIKKYNPCQIHKDAAGEVCCIKDYPYCDGCKFLGPDGCTTKCLGCKNGLCAPATDANPELDRVLFKMRRIAWALGLRGIRVSKKEVFDDLKNAILSNTARDLRVVLKKSGDN